MSDLETRFGADPPPEALRWVESAVGSQVAAMRRMQGATTAAVHALRMEDGRQFALKRFIWEDFVAEEPDRARHEGMAMRLLEGTAVPAPEVIAWDEHGTRADAPAVLATFVRGTVAIDTAPESLAEVAAAISSVDCSSMEWTYEPYFLGHDLFPPQWTENTAAWEALIEAATAIRTDSSTFVHRDYHPWNVLADDGEITGVVDWLSACAGPWQIDVAHCRGNLVLLNRFEDAERYRHEYEQLTGRQYDSEWGAMVCIDGLPFYNGSDAVNAWSGHDVINPYLGTKTQRELLDDFAARTAASLGR